MPRVREEVRAELTPRSTSENPHDLTEVFPDGDETFISLHREFPGSNERVTVVWWPFSPAHADGMSVGRRLHSHEFCSRAKPNGRRDQDQTPSRLKEEGRCLLRDGSLKNTDTELVAF